MLKEEKINKINSLKLATRATLGHFVVSKYCKVKFERKKKNTQCKGKVFESPQLLNGEKKICQILK